MRTYVYEIKFILSNGKEILDQVISCINTIDDIMIQIEENINKEEWYFISSTDFSKGCKQRIKFKTANIISYIITQIS